MDHKQSQTAELREISKLRLQTASLMQALLEARQQLQAANERAETLEAQLGSLDAYVRMIAKELDCHPERILERALSNTQAANERAAEAEAMLRAVLELEYIGNCPWCVFIYTEEQVPCAPDCPRQAAAAWLESGEGKGLEDKE